MPEFFMNPLLETTDIAKQLLGCVLSYTQNGKRRSGWIVETEAYLGEKDQAAHTYQGHQSKRVEALYAPAGTFYIHQMMQHTMINISTKENGNPEGVLIRAIQPIEGKDTMAKNRGNKPQLEWTNGPGKLTQALGVTMADYGTLATEGRLQISEEGRRQPLEIISGPRIGIPNKGKWTEAPLRFYIKGNPFVSRTAKKYHDLETYGWGE